MAEKLASKILKRAKSEVSDNSSKILDALALPQRILMQKAAEVAGVKPGATSEESAFNIIDKIATKAGLPEDSDFANALKATAVASLETFADPLGPLGKLTKFNKARIAARRGQKLARKVLEPVTTKSIWAERKAAQEAAAAERKLAGLPTADQGKFKKTLDKPTHEVKHPLDTDISRIGDK